MRAPLWFVAAGILLSMATPAWGQQPTPPPTGVHLDSGTLTAIGTGVGALIAAVLKLWTMIREERREVEARVDAAQAKGQTSADVAKAEGAIKLAELNAKLEKVQADRLADQAKVLTERLAEQVERRAAEGKIYGEREQLLREVMLTTTSLKASQDAQAAAFRDLTISVSDTLGGVHSMLERLGGQT